MKNFDLPKYGGCLNSTLFIRPKFHSHFWLWKKFVIKNPENNFKLIGKTVLQLQSPQTSETEFWEKIHLKFFVRYAAAKRRLYLKSFTTINNSPACLISQRILLKYFTYRKCVVYKNYLFEVLIRSAPINWLILDAL